MFQRFTEKARRVIFFARYEASRYGSREIATEHLLLGLVREDRALLNRFLGSSASPVDLRDDIERKIRRGEPISTSVEVPLTAESRKVLSLAIEEADQWTDRRVGSGHLLLGLLGVKGSLAERTLAARGMNAGEIRKTIAVESWRDPEPEFAETSVEALATLRTFLSGLSSMDVDVLLDYFAEDLSFVDSRGKRWERAEIAGSPDALFANYANRNADCIIEEPTLSTGDTFVVTVLWKNALVASAERKWMHRMGMVWIQQDGFWRIGFIQVTAVS
jgi:ketosteroid isomerase-like protein